MVESALIGNPPANDNDLAIIKGMIALSGMKKDPTLGVALPPKRPADPSMETKGPRVVASLAGAIFVIAFITGARLLARRVHKVSALGWDDLFITLAAAAAIVWLAIVIVMVEQGGVGQHIYNITYNEWYLFARYGYIDLIVFFVAVGFAKLGIICFNWRLTSSTSRTWKNVHRAFFVAVSCYLIISLFWSVFRCNPPTAATSLKVMGQGGAKCLSTNIMGTVLSSLHVAFDWALLLVPTIILLRLQASWKTKLRCLIPLTIGGLSCVGAALRIHYQLNPRPDVTWNFPIQLNWIILDLTCAVIVTSLPVLNSMLIVFLPQSIRRYWAETTNKRSYGRSTAHSTFTDNKQRGWATMKDVELESPAADGKSATSDHSAAALTTHEPVPALPKSDDRQYHSAAPVAANAANYATLREIEGRLKSIRNIEKITKTMKIVASTKLTRAQRAMTASRSYGQTSNTVFEQAETKALEGDDKKTLIVVASSDKGLCGGIHSGLSKKVRRMLEEKPNTDLAVLGEKSKAQLSRSNGKNIVLSFANIGKNVPTFADAQAIADQIAQLPTDYGNVQIVYNKFINATSYEPTPIETFSEEAIANSPNFAAFEIDDEVLANLKEYALANALFWALAEGHACEQSARRNAMDNASKNAGDMISKFQILFNRTRQAVITGELVEIITGAAASEDA
ncbi:MAG: atp3 gamma subunit of the F1 sector of mitochondrial F1F0 ATP synthase [Caeruleum heppii]|nr:MAG: atp3 gamma subunit of the F1 sector of mitochondrial F1F0 ATP synthase [Caeruleum heppii]